MVRRLRTAVLVVHGMGSQRPLETVRGIINAVWFNNDDHIQDKTHKLWSHPEPSGVDLDLTVMTTNDFKDPAGGRVADFHELYWAHLMSETKAVAVLLWLFELGRKGPNLKTGMNGLWWCGAVYLCLLLLSISLLVLQSIMWLTSIGGEPQKIVFVFDLMLLIAAAAGLVAAIWYRYWKLFLALTVVLIAMIAGAKWITSYDQLLLARWTSAFIAPVGALLAASLLMKAWGRIVFVMTYTLSLAFFAITLLTQHQVGFWENVVGHINKADMPWGLPSHPSTIAAICIIGVYLLMNAAFLQPYLGDAARYFRNSPANVAVRRAIRKEAVDTLDQLHCSRDYDRIVVVAHSLGTAVAYDMLRAYYSRICDQVSIDRDIHDPEFEVVDDKAAAAGPIGAKKCAAMRVAARQLIAKLAAGSRLIADQVRRDQYKPAKSEEVDVWLVTDFVTLGSPLTHAVYFMANGKDRKGLEADFEDHKRERELPTCPPQKIDDDGRIAYEDPNTKKPRLHHGGTFGLTRWTNLFFPTTNIFWGDAIGGPVKPVFGDCVKDIEVSTKIGGGAGFFTHVAYWKTDCKAKRAAPHLAALVNAIDLRDKDKVSPPKA